jgi:hypothetical protein
MTYLETLLESATAEAKSMHNENMRLNDQIKSQQVTLDKTTTKLNHAAMTVEDLKVRLALALEQQTNIMQTWGGYTFEQFKAVLNSHRFMTERLQRLNNEPNGEKLSWWQRLVVREALGMDNPTPPSLTGGGMALGVYREPEKWIIEVWQKTNNKWERSQNEDTHGEFSTNKWERSQNEDTHGEFSTEESALEAIETNEQRFPGEGMVRRARRIA